MLGELVAADTVPARRIRVPAPGVRVNLPRAESVPVTAMLGPSRRVAAVGSMVSLSQDAGRGPGRRADLTLLPGGRSPAAQQAMAATYRRRRIVAALVAVTALLVVLRLLGMLGGAAAAWAGPVEAPIEGPVVEVVAERGDTLWTIAREVHPQGDIRPSVEAMLGERGSASLQVGDVVRVPADAP